MTVQLTKLVAVVGIVNAILCFAPKSKGDDAQPTRIAAQTVYQHDDIEGFHRVAIVGVPNGNGTLILNPNHCSINEFGDTVGCTRMAETIANIRIKDTMTPDPAHLGRKLYSLEGTGLSNPLLLAIWPTADRPARLIYNNRGPNAPRPITLEPLVYSADPAPKSTAEIELCNATYLAQQVPGVVIVFATGLHPSAGFQTFFEELPITIYPPQFRLLHIKPTGPVSQVVTPFQLYTSFPAQQKVERVVIHDSSGRHEVVVEQVPDVK